MKCKILLQHLAWICALIAFTNTTAAQDSSYSFFSLNQQPDFQNSELIHSAGKLIIRNTNPGIDKKQYIRIYDGKKWDKLSAIEAISQYAFPSYPFTTVGIVNKDIIFAGIFKSIDGNYPPTGKSFIGAVYKGGKWDTLPGLIPDSIKNTYMYVNDSGIYAIDRLNANSARIYRISPTTGILNVWTISNTTSIDSIYVSVNRNALFIHANFNKLDGVTHSPFFYLIGSKVVTPTLAYNSKIIRSGMDENGNLAYVSSPSPYVYHYNFNKKTNQNISNGKMFIQLQTIHYQNGAVLIPVPGYQADTLLKCHLLKTLSDTWVMVKGINTNYPLQFIGVHQQGFFGLGRFGYQGPIYQLELAAKIKGFVYIDNDLNCTYSSTKDSVARNIRLTFYNKSFRQTVFCDEKGQYEIFVRKGDYTYKYEDVFFDTLNCNKKSIQIKSYSSTTWDIPFRLVCTKESFTKLNKMKRMRWLDTIDFGVYAYYFAIKKHSLAYHLELPNGFSAHEISHNGTQNGNVISWKIDTFKPFTFYTLKVKLVMNKNQIKIGDTVCFHAFQDSIDGECDIDNNHDTSCYVLVAAYDPNQITVNPEKEIPLNTKKLDYFVEFQNLGSDYARHVIVVDTLPNEVDLESLQISGGSHRFSFSLKGQVLTLYFYNIYLDYAAKNEPASHGSFGYSVNLKPNLPEGTVVNNKAYIYFDYNPAVITNTAWVKLTEKVKSESLPSTSKLFSVYPNPSDGNVIIKNESNLSMPLAVYSLTGTLVHQSQCSSGLTTLQLSHLAAGNYIIKLGSQSLIWSKY